MLIGEVNNVSDYLHAMNPFIMPSLFERLSAVSIEAQVNGLKCIFLENITKDCKVTENVEFSRINNVAEWFNLLLNNMNDFEYNRYAKMNKDYEIEVQSK